MIVVDSSVWIDHLNAKQTPQTSQLIELLGSLPIALIDLTLTEVLQGTRSDADFARAKRILEGMTLISGADPIVSVTAAHNYRQLRAKGVTVRSTIDTLIATRCIVDNHQLLHSDRDFDAFEEHLRLRVFRGFGD